MTTKITEQNISNLANAGVDWQSVKTGNFTAVAGEGYFVDTTSTAITVTLPASPNQGDTIKITDYTGTFGTNNVTIDPNGGKIDSSTVNGTLATNNDSLTLVYIDSSEGWKQLNLDTSDRINIPLYVSASGGTVSTSGDYKTHAFTGDGCFVVSCAGNASGSSSVDYLVVAGGGGGGGDGGGGGGAGGFRLSNSTCMPAPLTSPLATPTGITVTVQSYPITVGGGGIGGIYSPANEGTDGSNSTFSTITSAGGAGGATYLNCGAGNNGGSGSGGTRAGGGGTGNTPPVSPPQGNPGGPGGPAPSGDGGGGAGAAGGNATGPGGAGGVGSYVIETGFGGGNGTPGPVGSTKYFAGGGGGGADQVPATGGAGGAGGGGAGGDRPVPSPNGEAGTANTGGGGGGAGVPNNAGNGGKGIVLIRYKYQ